MVTRMGWGEGRRGNEGLWIGELGESGALVDHAYAFEKKKAQSSSDFSHALTLSQPQIFVSDIIFSP
ncbi:MAG: hypothetical protein CL912_13375 [Deltaproteobacteria bacterium]|nr:hypothetical protein [Deltaproteobacteria bacterium]